MLEAIKISAAYGDANVLNDISFVLDEGMILAVLGPNGAGKTSLIKTLNGSLQLVQGMVSINGSPLSSYSGREVARMIAVVAQENETKFPVRVLEYVLAGRFAHGGVFGWESEEDIQIAMDALAQCEMSDYHTRNMNELSGGERQRVVFARALATRAKILLLDEPTTNLDIAHEVIMFRIVKKRCQELGQSAILITHDLNLANEFADRVLLLRGGHVHSMGAPKDVVTKNSLLEIFGVDVQLDQNPVSGKIRITTIY